MTEFKDKTRCCNRIVHFLTIKPLWYKYIRILAWVYNDDFKGRDKFIPYLRIVNILNRIYESVRAHRQAIFSISHDKAVLTRIIRRVGDAEVFSVRKLLIICQYFHLDPATVNQGSNLLRNLIIGPLVENLWVSQFICPC